MVEVTKNLICFLVILIVLTGVASSLRWDAVAYWSLDNNTKDISGNNQDATIFGAPVFGVEGILGKSIDFNYSEGHDNYLNASDIDLEGSATYSLWVFQNKDDHESTFLSKRDRWGGTTIEISGKNNVNFCIRTVSKDSKKGWTPIKQFFNNLSRILFKKDFKNYTFWGLKELEYSCIEGVVPYLNDWYHVVAVYNYQAKNMSLYINGKYFSSTEHLSGLPLNNKSYVVGANAMGSEGYDGGKGGSEGTVGRIDEVGIWNRALSKEEILELYGSSKGLGFGK